MARRPFVRPARSGAVHNKEWTTACLIPSDIDNAIGAGGAFVIFTATEAETILRMRGEVYLELDATASNEMVTMAIGIAVVSARAAAAGSASVPRPASEGSFPWLWHGWLIVSSGQEAAVNDNSLIARLTVDSKAMRKIKEDEVIVLALEVCAARDQGGNTTVMGGFRALTGD